ncbi:hypothetical protein [Pleomorphochaeta sp. DL1XJH-081]|uniref:hypothetical protein n=1 Tax=Pleomorphochaeta sp. DL1XJH-081 TaxID=3409690 RepID=UPI003BB5F56D
MQLTPRIPHDFGSILHEQLCLILRSIQNRTTSSRRHDANVPADFVDLHSLRRFNDHLVLDMHHDATPGGLESLHGKLISDGRLSAVTHHTGFSSSIIPDDDTMSRYAICKVAHLFLASGGAHNNSADRLRSMRFRIVVTPMPVKFE